ncbi:exodeoxyribonuclease VII small subunit [Candidatus Saccharibacteria bacterium]|jgi:exodeoxyribonuclease VII small subunit|nr:exodeoxyribonuclease VII small subunit [Candidatus Saccharibacteria bacterium]
MSAKNKTIEEKMNDLRELTAWFESEDFSLTAAAEKFEEANTLANEIEHDLTELRNNVNVLKQSFDA